MLSIFLSGFSWQADLAGDYKCPDILLHAGLPVLPLQELQDVRGPRICCYRGPVAPEKYLGPDRGEDIESLRVWLSSECLKVGWFWRGLSQ